MIFNLLTLTRARPIVTPLKVFQLPSGKTVRAQRGLMRIGRLKFKDADVAEICRIFLTEIPLDGDGDLRLKLVEEIRASTIKEVRKSRPKRWIVLDAARLFASNGKEPSN